MISHWLANVYAEQWVDYLEDCIEHIATIDSAEFYVATDRELQAFMRDQKVIAWQTGDYVLVRAKYLFNRALVAHETCHVRQSRTVALFPVRYWLSSLANGYYNNVFEKEARAAERRANRRI